MMLVMVSCQALAQPEKKTFIARNQTPVHKTDAELQPDLLIGERLFYGLAPFEAGKLNCEGCHSTISSEAMNWNPSAYDLSVWIQNKKDQDLRKAFEAPSSEKMEASHKNLQINEAEAKKLRTYLNWVNSKGLAAHKPFPIRLIIFFTFGLLMAMALIDLIKTRFVKYRIIHVLVLITGLAVHVQMAAVEAQELSRTQHYAPDQPIKFSHKIHAGENKIDCQYCHSGVMHGKSAGLPSVALCMNCHNLVRNGRNSGKFEINKILTAFQEKRPVEWVRIHNLPEHAYFNHAQHVAVGKVACQTCHGAVEEMEIMQQYADLSMGWCINCHRQTNIAFDQNAYYHKNKKLLELLRSGKVKQPTAETAGGLDCMRCHY